MILDDKKTELVERILGIILQTSEDHPISRRDLMSQLHVKLYSEEDRTVRKIYHEVLAFDYPLGSNSHDGYYLCRTKEGKDKAKAELISRATKCLEEADRLEETFNKQHREYVQVEMFQSPERTAV